MKFSSTPWGQVQHQKQLAPGIVMVSTAGHGGIWLSPERQAQLPAWALEISNSYGPKPMWWEEDCESMVVLYVFFEEIGRHFPSMTKEKVSLYIQHIGYLNFPQAA
jgi:hypothetical protein